MLHRLFIFRMILKRGFMDFLAVKQNVLRGDLAVIRKQAHDGIHRLALAGTGFADDTEHLLRINTERDVADRVNGALIGGEIHSQMINF